MAKLRINIFMAKPESKAAPNRFIIQSVGSSAKSIVRQIPGISPPEADACLCGL